MKKKQLSKNKIFAIIGTVILLIGATASILGVLLSTGEIKIEYFYGPQAQAIYIILSVFIFAIIGFFIYKKNMGE